MWECIVCHISFLCHVGIQMAKTSCLVFSFLPFVSLVYILPGHFSASLCQCPNLENPNMQKFRNIWPLTYRISKSVKRDVVTYFLLNIFNPFGVQFDATNMEDRGFESTNSTIVWGRRMWGQLMKIANTFHQVIVPRKTNLYMYSMVIKW